MYNNNPYFVKTSIHLGRQQNFDEFVSLMLTTRGNQTGHEPTKADALKVLKFKQADKKLKISPHARFEDIETELRIVDEMRKEVEKLDAELGPAMAKEHLGHISPKEFAKLKMQWAQKKSKTDHLHWKWSRILALKSWYEKLK